MQTTSLSEHEEADKDYPLFAKPTHFVVGEEHPHAIEEHLGNSWIYPTILNDKNYEFILPEHLFLRRGKFPATLSTAQAEAIALACLSLEQRLSTGERQGFLLGDNTGMGKTRTLVGIMYELLTREKCTGAIFVSVNHVLLNFLLREMKRIFPGGIHRVVTVDMGLKFDGFEKEDIVFCTYKSLSNSKSAKVIEDWVRKDTLIIFDEYQAGQGISVSGTNKPSKTADVIIRWQKRFKDTRFVFSTAISRYDTQVFRFIKRLGLWGPNTHFVDQKDFEVQMSRRGENAFEWLTMTMKDKGVFISRQISYRNLQFTCHTAKMVNNAQAIVYNWATKLVRLVHKLILQTDYEDASLRLPRFYGASHALFDSLIFSSKLDEAAKLTRQELEKGNSVILGFQHTGQSCFYKFLHHHGREGQPFSVAEYILRDMLSLCDIHMDAQKTYLCNGNVEIFEFFEPAKTNSKVSNDTFSSEEDYSYFKPSSPGMVKLGAPPKHLKCAVDESKRRKRSRLMSQTQICAFEPFTVGFYSGRQPSELTWSSDEHEVEDDDAISCDIVIRLFYELCPFLPINPLDELLCRLSDLKLCELTGRRMTYELYSKTNTDSFHEWKAVLKCNTPKAKLATMNEFINDKVEIAVSSDTGLIGLSLNADNNINNIRGTNMTQRGRTILQLELPLAIDKIVQQTGRCLRSSQVFPPHYILLNSWIPGGIRSTSIAAKQMGILSAICNDNKVKASTLLSCQFEDLYSLSVYDVIKQLSQTHFPDHNLFSEIFTKQHNCNDTTLQFFNRLLMLPIQSQQRFVNDLEDKLPQRIKTAKRFNEYPKQDCDGATLEWVENKRLTVEEPHYNGMVPRINSLTFMYDQTLPWPKHDFGKDATFYQRNGPTRDVFICVKRKLQGSACYVSKILVPHRRDVVRVNGSPDLYGSEITFNEAEQIWKNRISEMNEGTCIHKAQNLPCNLGNSCDIGRGRKKIRILVGDVFSIWDRLEDESEQQELCITRVHFTPPGATTKIDKVGIEVSDSMFSAITDT